MKNFKQIMQRLKRLSLTALATTSLAIIPVATWNKSVMAEQPHNFSVVPGVANNALNGNWRLFWRFDGVPQNAWLHMNGNYGTMTVNAVLPNGRRIIARESMTLTPNGNGFILSGSQPVYPGTWTPNYNYNPDSFQIQENYNGSLNVQDCSSGACVPVTMIHQYY
ncbi:MULTISPECIES: hypothetical protein [Nostocales]|uniref:Uncharacterized protein n=3 Tax=Nostocales TaxID=1161 RepID=A0A0C1R426_9CYAN|nr:hypothetical protein [Tolypothrix bouteillei]KAF3889535.1 hypothetical protein DA73_0400031710 [Tolypothrix bouteillei VB521301]